MRSRKFWRKLAQRPVRISNAQAMIDNEFPAVDKAMCKSHGRLFKPVFLFYEHVSAQS